MKILPTLRDRPSMPLMVALAILALILAVTSSLQAATISGRVTDINGAPLEGIAIQQYAGCSKARKMNPGGVFTNADGYYVIQTPNAPCYVTWVRPEPDPDLFTISYPNAAVFMFYPQGLANFVLDN